MEMSSTEQDWPGPDDEPYELFDEIQPYPDGPPPFSLSALGTAIHRAFEGLAPWVHVTYAGKIYRSAVFDEIEVWHTDPLFEDRKEEKEAPPRKHKWVPIPKGPPRPPMNLAPRTDRSSRTGWRGSYRRIR